MSKQYTKIKNYIKFAKELADKTGFEVTPEIISKSTEHIHYHFIKGKITYATLCTNDIVSLTIFDADERSEGYISSIYFPLISELDPIFKVVKELFVEAE